VLVKTPLARGRCPSKLQQSHGVTDTLGSAGFRENTKPLVDQTHRSVPSPDAALQFSFLMRCLTHITTSILITPWPTN
jgi:hypothetical protein